MSPSGLGCAGRVGCLSAHVSGSWVKQSAIQRRHLATKAASPDGKPVEMRLSAVGTPPCCRLSYLSVPDPTEVGGQRDQNFSVASKIASKSEVWGRGADALHEVAHLLVP